MRKTRRAPPAPFVHVLCGLALLTAACHAPITLLPLPRGEPAPPASWRAGVELLVLADLQHHIPYEEMELPSVLTTFGKTHGHLEKAAAGFYRHALRSTLVPEALEWTILRAKSRGIRYGILAGDLADLGCKGELDAILVVLSRHPELRFVVALGNHDVAPLGTLSPRRTREWEAACQNHGGPLHKGAMVRAVLDYYQSAWGLALPAELPGGAGVGGAPATVRLTARHADTGIEAVVTASYRTEPRETCKRSGTLACVHREAYLFQRVELRGSGRATTLTVLDTVDYADSPIMSKGAASKLLHLGVAGGVSRAQVAWLRALPRPAGLHLAVSHFVPFEAIEQSPAEVCLPRAKEEGPGAPPCFRSDFSETNVTHNARASGLEDFILSLGDDAVAVYSHSHEAPLAGRLVRTAEENKDGAGVRAMRIPSLIDNGRGVVFSGGRFESLTLPREGDVLLLDREPRYWGTLYGRGDLCKARARDYFDTGRVLHRFTLGQCPREPLSELRKEGEEICRHVSFEKGRGYTGHSRPWIRHHYARWQGFMDVECRDATRHEKVVKRSEAWRCIFRARAAALLRRCLEGDRQKWIDFGARVVGSPWKMNP